MHEERIEEVPGVHRPFCTLSGCTNEAVQRIRYTSGRGSIAMAREIRLCEAHSSRVQERQPVQCEVCGQTVPASATRTVNVRHGFSRRAVRACPCTASIRCGACLSYIARENEEWALGTDGRCRACSRSHEERESIYRPYARGVAHGPDGEYIPADVSVGVEIEAKVPHENLIELSLALPDTAGIARDGSLQSNEKLQAVEIITPPATGKNAEGLIRTCMRELRRAGAKVDRECGFHVHVSGESLYKRTGKATKLVRLWNLYRSYAGVIAAFLPKERRGNRYCKPLELFPSFEPSLTDSFAKLQQKFYGVDGQSFSRCAARREAEREQMRHYHPNRYYQLNLHSLFTRGTVEFRSHSGTLNETKALEWTRLHVRLVMLAQKRGLKVPAAGETSAASLFKALALPKDARAYFLERAAKFEADEVSEFDYTPVIKNETTCAA